MRIDVIERLSVDSFIENDAHYKKGSVQVSSAGTPKNRISSWILVDMNLRGKSGVMYEDNSPVSQNAPLLSSILIVGTESGRMLYFSIPHAPVVEKNTSASSSPIQEADLTSVAAIKSVPNLRGIRPVEVTVLNSTTHFAPITALMVVWQPNSTPSTSSYSFGAKYPNDSLLVFSGSSDRTIKIWNFNDISNGIAGGTGGSSSSTTSQANILAQTLCGHNSAITQIVDGGRDGLGSVLSASMDGSIRIWIPQRYHDEPG